MFLKTCFNTCSCRANNPMNRILKSQKAQPKVFKAKKTNPIINW